MFVHLNFGKEFASNQLVIAEPDIATLHLFANVSNYSWQFLQLCIFILNLLLQNKNYMFGSMIPAGINVE